MSDALALVGAIRGHLAQIQGIIGLERALHDDDEMLWSLQVFLRSAQDKVDDLGSLLGEADDA